MSDNKYNYITIGEDEYRVQKFNAMTGLRVARLVVSKLMPIVPALAGDGSGGTVGVMLDRLGEALGNITDGELEKLTVDCLKHCAKKLPSGYVPILDEKGNYRVQDIEFDAPLTLRLVIEAIRHGAMDFFGGSNPALAGLAQSITPLLNR
jgi:hypothetical protein